MDEVTLRIREIISEALGANDNKSAKEPHFGEVGKDINFVFNAPVTIISKEAKPPST